MALDYKQRYIEIRAKFIESTDLAFRMGYEQGMREATQQAQAQQIQAATQPIIDEQGNVIQQGQPVPGQLVDPTQSMPEEAVDPSQQSELDQYISQLGDMVKKGEKPTVLGLRDVVQKLVEVRDLQKNKKPEKPVLKYEQKRIVDNIIKNWKEEDVKKESNKNIQSLLQKAEELIKK